MDMIKIGKFIAEKRKSQNLTQIQLAEKLCITDRAISKWECGKALPDSSLMLELCEILKISVNELLTGEELNMNDYNKQAELNLIEMKKQKEEADKRLLSAEIVIGVTGTISLVLLIMIAALINMETWLRILLIILGFVIFFVSCLFAVSIEQKAGYYECKNCHNKFVPNYKETLFAMHMGRTRYLRCPHCKKKAWQKKVLSNDDNKE